ncbi:hypothetical protein GCM10009716_31390 [Streptomyces sodiiphilus]|uniref:NodB homology domain-containing protein n=1 Tax=Streptomyces sodiiphilus TaxID=226217 RepID=A0ABN2PFM9_9ACTN
MSDEPRPSGSSGRSRLRRRALAGGVTILAVACAVAGAGTGALPGVAEWRPLSALRGPVGEEVTGLSAPPPARAAPGALAAHAERLERAERRRVTAARTWGLRAVPLRPPAPPKRKPALSTESGHLKGPGLPPVITRVPTGDKVVFLTIDDGAEKDDRLLEMMRQLDVPYSSFLADYVARDDYDYFRKAHRNGSAVHNHSVNHREMNKLPYREQRREICRQQDILEREIGERPELFRPPYGAYNTDTLRAARDCGVRVVPLWAEEAFPDRIEYGRADRRLHPGDIVLSHFRGRGEWDGDMPAMVRRVVDTATAQGFAIARLEDYI